jgi:putative hydrolase of HD superfamily
LQPFLHNTLTGGHTWVENGTKRSDVEKRMRIIKDFMPEVYDWVSVNLDRAVENGWVN